MKSLKSEKRVDEFLFNTFDEILSEDELKSKADELIHALSI